MDELRGTETVLVDETSEQFLGEWNRLVSVTNWEKGRIIGQWRQALISAGASIQDYSDEAWSRRVAHVSSQHVGRLRRVFERFGQVRQDYAGLFWSHFQAALDWSDAEMWLEGAVQNRWSVSQMRRQRWETLGGSEADEPRDEDIVVAELDEDAKPIPQPVEPPAVSNSVGVVHDPGSPNQRQSGEDFSAGNAELAEACEGVPFDSDPEAYPARAGEEPVRPFADLPRLPEDVNEAFEAYKLAILRHKLADWQEISRDDLLASLEALKRLAMAPSVG
ncbi:MAG: hypothetical protein ACYC35_15100 [Pirellulales bacterium]